MNAGSLQVAETTPNSVADWILRKAAPFDFTDDLPMTRFPTPFLAIAAYVLSTLALSRWARQRSGHPIATRWFAVAYNFSMVAISLATCALSCIAFLDRMSHVGLRGMLCETGGHVGGLWAVSSYTYYLTKFLEFIDTVLLALRCRRISWLHLYHHSGIVVVSWLWIHSRVFLLLWLVAINSGIHVIMYSYFLLCAVGRRPTWKQGLTVLQIAQLIFGLAVGFVLLFLHATGNCSEFLWVNEVFFGILANVILVAFFFNFYFQTYGPRAIANAEEKAKSA